MNYYPTGRRTQSIDDWIVSYTDVQLGIPSDDTHSVASWDIESSDDGELSARRPRKPASHVGYDSQGSDYSSEHEDWVTKLQHEAGLCGHARPLAPPPTPECSADHLPTVTRNLSTGKLDTFNPASRDRLASIDYLYADEDPEGPLETSPLSTGSALLAVPTVSTAAATCVATGQMGGSRASDAAIPKSKSLGTGLSILAKLSAIPMCREDVALFKKFRSMVSRGNTSTVKKMLARNFARALTKGQGSVTLHQAKTDLNSTVADLTLWHSGRDSTTALHLAASKGRVKISRQLILFGAEIDAVDATGNTPLHLAAQHDHLRVVEFLVSRGARVNNPNSFGWTPIHVAAQHGSKKVIRALVSAGATINAVNSDAGGDTALHLAARANKAKTIALLLQSGADPHQRNTQAQTAAQLSTKAKVKKVFAARKCAQFALPVQSRRSRGLSGASSR